MPDILADAAAPAGHSTLYHYTSLPGLKEIVEDQVLWASNAHYLSDIKEIRHAHDMLLAEIVERLKSADALAAEVLTQLRHWLLERAIGPQQLFLCPFTEEGNLLSQWRGYTPHGLGVSLGFPASRIMALAATQGYRLVQCIYEEREQRRLVGGVVDAMFAALHKDTALCAGGGKTSYQAVFDRFTDDLLLLAAVLKHGSFREEREWRVISRLYDDDPPDAAVKYRVGRFTLIPYREFSLAEGPGCALNLDEVVVGPSSSLELSMHSIPQYLASRGVSARNGVRSCGIPYRG